MGLNNSFSGAPSNTNVVWSNPLQMPDFSNWMAMNEFVNPGSTATNVNSNEGYFSQLYSGLRKKNLMPSQQVDVSYNPVQNNSEQQINWFDPNSTKNLFNEQQNKLNQLGFKVGLMTYDSTNPSIAANGQTMVNQAVSGQNVTGQQQTNTNGTDRDSSVTTNGTDYWSAGAQAANQIGSRIGGKAGSTINSLGGIASGVSALKSAKNIIKNAGSNTTKAMKQGKLGAGMSIAGSVADIASSFLPEKSEYTGDKGNITETMDSAYDGISDAAMAFGPIGQMVGGIMKGGKLLSKGVNAIGGGTSGMTTTDAILGSSFLSLTPIGLINGFGGSTTKTITKDDDAFEEVGASYLGSNSTVDNAVHKSGKKYGLFSKKQFRKAQDEIDNARLQQDVISQIADESKIQRQLQASMSTINSNRYAMKMQGGFDPTAIRAAKHGMSIELINKAKSIILKAQQGAKLNPMEQYQKLVPENWETFSDNKPTYQDWVKDVNPNFINDNYDLEAAYNNLPYSEMQRWKFAVNRPTKKEQDYYLDYNVNGYFPFHTGSVAPLQGTEDYIFLKKGKLENNPELKGELDYYNNSGDFKKNYKLSYEGDRYYYRKQKPYIKQETPQHKNGGSINNETFIELVSPLELPQHKNGGSITELKIESFIELIDPNTIPEFQNGGSINVIPDGALHARKHNMDLDGITKKGIPVISENQNGKIEQQAEIEKEEVILRLEVTQKIEELYKKYYNDDSTQKEKDEYALEAGKLITKELLHNTKDNAGLL